MRILITSARLPHALGLARLLGEAGHRVFATDTFRTSPGLHSRHVEKAILTDSPRFRTRTFVGQVADAVKEHDIDLVVPAFEEVFYLARHLGDLPDPERYFCSPLETLALLHDKQRFVALAEQLGLPVGKTIIATNDDALREAAGAFEHYFGRPAFSRGGVALLTNTGPLAGAVAIEECKPTPECPWLVQEYVQGEDLCSFSVAHRGRITAHATYRHPLTIEHAGGIVFESLDDPEIVAAASRIVSHLGYHGNISFDWMRTESGELHLVECNPRPTAGIFTMQAEPFAAALIEPDGAPYVVPAGARAQIDSAIVRDMFREPSEIPRDLELLFSGTRDVYAQKGDRLPGLYQILSYAHVFAFRRRMHVGRHKHSDLIEAQFFDVEWDGGEID